MAHCVKKIPLMVALAVATLPAISARGQFQELLTKLPPGPNVIVMVNPQQIFSSEVGVQGGWKQKYDETFNSVPLLMPPDAQQFVLTADLDLPTMKPQWEAAVMRLGSDPSIEQVTRLVHGTRDTVAGVEAVATERGGMIVKFGPRMYGMIRPGSRQTVSRWVRSAVGSTVVTLSPYLKAAADVPDRVGTEIIMSIDMTDALNRDRVRQALENSEVLKKSSIGVASATETIVGLQGATLGVRVTSRVFGVLKLDFSGETKPIAEVAKPLVLEVLSEAGASIDEFANWTPNVTPHRITLEGELTASGLRRLFSFLELDTTAVAAPEGGAEALSATQAASAEATKTLQYFQAVQGYLNDLRHEDGATSYASIALWFDKYARRIEKLPILGVDKDMVDYGQYVIYQLRNAVDAIRGVGIRSGASPQT